MHDPLLAACETGRPRHEWRRGLTRCTLVLREIVLGRLAALIKKFVRQVSLSRGLSEAAANAQEAKSTPSVHTGSAYTARELT